MSEYPPMDVGCASICYGLLLIVLALFGLMVNGNNIMIMLTTRLRRTSHGFLCIVRGICNIINLSIFILYTGPNTAFQFYSPYDETGRIMCLFVTGTYAAYPFMQFGIVYNRITALFFPFKFDKICPVQASWVFVTLGLFYAAFFIAHQLALGCRFAYDAKMLKWQYLNCPYEDKKYIYIIPILIMTGIVMILNSAVAFRVMMKELKATTSGLNEKKNKRMFWQGFVQDVFNANDLIWQCFLSGLINSRIWVFIAETLVWELSPICDGLVFLFFDVRMRRLFWSKRSNFVQVTTQAPQYAAVSIKPSQSRLGSSWITTLTLDMLKK